VLSAFLLVGQIGTVPKAAQAAGSNSVAYIHDQAGRLVGVVDSTNAATYKYDAVGNVLSISRYSAATVSIIQMTPGSAPTGAQVIIYGTAFSATPSQNAITFNGTAAVASVVLGNSDRHICTVGCHQRHGQGGLSERLGHEHFAFTVIWATVEWRVLQWSPTVTSIIAHIVEGG
jgi:YD repeat-containing protein